MPRVVDAGRRRAEFTEAAARLIARSGVEAATLREVASEAGWTTGAITHWFPDKRALLLATFQQSLDHRRAMRPDPATTTSAEQLRASLEGALPLDDDRRLHWTVTLACAAQAAADPELATAQRMAYREFRRHITALLSAGGRHDARAHAERLIAAADGVAMQAIFDPASWPPRRQLAALDAIIAALSGDALHAVGLSGSAPRFGNGRRTIAGSRGARDAHR
jgi:AcrR family transcriptional regulator